MSVKKRSSSSVSVVQIILMVALVLAALIGLAFMLVPRKPTAPPVSRISYEARPEEQKRDYSPSPAFEEEISEVLAPAAQITVPEVVIDKEEAPVEELPFTLMGTIMDQKTNKPIAGARIVVQRKQSPEDNVLWASLDERERKAMRSALNTQHPARSSRSGEFKIALEHAGQYEVEAVAVGYVKATQLSPVISENSSEVRVNLALSSGATISGRVTVADSGEGVPGVTVQAERSEGNHAITDGQGYYEMRGLQPGLVGLAVDLRGTSYMSGKNLPYQKVEIRNPDEEVKNIDFTVEAAGVIWGYVMSPDQQPVSGANVVLATAQSMLSQALSQISRKTPPIMDSSGEDGYYELTGIPFNEEWHVHASTDDYAPQMSDPVILSPSHRNVRVDVFMFAGSNVYGMIVDNQGHAIPGAQVTCMPAYSSFFSNLKAPQAFRHTMSDESGRFIINELPGGEYQIFAQKKAYKVTPLGFPIHPDGYSDLSNVVLRLSSAEEGEHNVFGTVVDDRGQTLDGVNLQLSGVTLGGLEGTQRSETSAGSGKFHFTGISAGQYTIIASMDGYTPTTVRRVRLNEETKILMKQSALVRGRVLLKENNEAPESYQVGAYPISESSGSVSLMGMLRDAATEEEFYAPDGSFSLSIHAGTYRLEASTPGYTPAREEITLEAGQVLDNVLLLLDEKGGRIAGTVFAKDNASVTGAEVTLLEASSPAEALMMLASGNVPDNRRYQVGEEGAFFFESLPPGEYVAIAQHPNYPNAQSELIIMDEGGREENVRIRFTAGGALEGYVYNEGVAVPNAVVMVVGNGITGHANADENGYYYIGDLSAGLYQAMVTDISSGDLSTIYDARGVQVMVEDGQATRYDFGTQEGARIEGLCMPGPSNMLGGRAVLQRPGYPQVPLGETVDVTELLGQSVGINPGGQFVMEDVMPGEWQLDIYYFELGIINPLEVRYVHSEFIEVEQGEVIPLTLEIMF
ncbi:MAG: hypothetical protein GX130_09920 [Candidatus Hydrogenedens sp.]|jgi:hypothetical protein|nr:hypothetical protein [Candidatus Hydrogenedens sp.]